MKKKRYVSSVPGKRVPRNVGHIPDHKLDFSDIPESTNEELKRAKRVGRPTTGHAKQLIAIRLNPSLLATLKKIAVKQSKPYQTLIHELLEKSVKKIA